MPHYGETIKNPIRKAYERGASVSGLSEEYGV